ncbi:ATP-binding protein [Calditrichota bacterium GD2]
MMVSFLRNHSVHSIFRMIAVPTVLITGFIVYFIASKTLHYKLEATYYPANRMLELYHDFDKDGFSEVIQAFYNPQIHHSHVVISKHTGAIINEWVIPGFCSFERDLKKQWIDFGDVNRDNFDELILFIQQNDSLFLTVIDVKNSENNQGKYIIPRSFLLKRSLQNIGLPWDIYYNHHAVVDLNNDGQVELVFTLVSGYSLSPRGIYVYNFKQKKIVHQYETNAALMEVDFFDLDGDGKKEIIASTYAGANFPSDAPQSDFYSWIFAFDDALQPLFQPVKLYGFTSSFRGLGVRDGDERYILGLASDTGKSNEPARLLKINKKGKILKLLEIPIANKWTPYLFRIQDDSVLFIIVDQHNKVLCFNKHFELLCQKQFKNRIFFHTAVDLDRDGQKELLATMPFRLLVFDKKLNLLAQSVTNVGKALPLISIEEDGKENNKKIHLSTDGTRAFYSFMAYPMYKNRKFLLVLGLWMVLVLFLLFLNSNGIQSLVRWNALSIIQKINQSGILITDDRGRVLLHNMAFLNKLNLKEVLEKGKSVKLQLKNHAQLVAFLEEAMKEKEEVKRSISINGNPSTIVISPIRGWVGCVVGYYIEVLEKETNCLDERTKIWTNTIKKLAHDIKTPLSNIEVGVRTVKDSLEKHSIPPKNILIEDLDILSHEVKRITNIVRNFLKFVNLEKPRFQLSDIHQCINKSIVHFEAYWKNNFTIEVEFEAEIPPFYFDPQQLELVFNNLIKNALDALGENGKIIIRSSLIEDEISQKPQHYCEIEVTDNGIGITKEKLMYIFEPDFTDKKEGSGMGLTIVKKIIEDHGGEIKVFSAPNLGTTFRVLLPLKREMSEIDLT